MKKYKNLEGSSGVTRYEVQPESIVVEFNDADRYLYTYTSSGKKAIEKMKLLAAEGKGLSTYISQSVKEKFAKKLN
jgi:hypothetical protein